ncbi:hypothetical protein EAS61_26110 [Bradyrhizobium zhanjiangense]|uniref:Uncharacterized protein n=1 Tax=Bradyrhizobium zhanjiangense TaxID=1325107 RepID=A0A4Q0QFL9_9BRAD|nr:hypothetical protein EAS61_26110 [Bradyrhizobium zhanjiangense]
MERLAAERQFMSSEDQTLLREQAATSGTKAIRLEGSGVLRLPRARGRASSLPPRRHCERSEAIQKCIRGKTLDCFARSQ